MKIPWINTKLHKINVAVFRDTYSNDRYILYSDLLQTLIDTFKDEFGRDKTYQFKYLNGNNFFDDKKMHLIDPLQNLPYFVKVKRIEEEECIR